MPPMTASSFFSLATSLEVRSNRFITLVLREAVLVWVFMPITLVEGLAAGQQRRQDQRHRRLRGNGLLDRPVDDEIELVEPGRGVMLHRQRVQHRPHGAAN